MSNDPEIKGLHNGLHGTGSMDADRQVTMTAETDRRTDCLVLDVHADRNTLDNR